MSLNPRPARYAEARVARLNRKSELNRLPPTQFLACGTSLGEALGLPRERLITHWPVGALSSYSRDRLFHLPASAFHPNEPASAASRSGSGGRHSRGFPTARCFKRASKYHGREQTETSYLSGFHSFLSVEDLALHFCFELVLKRLLPNEARFARHVAHSLSHPVAWCSGRRRAAPASIRLGCVRPGRKSDRRSADHREVHRQGNEKGGPEAQDAGR